MKTTKVKPASSAAPRQTPPVTHHQLGVYLQRTGWRNAGQVHDKVGLLGEVWTHPLSQWVADLPLDTSLADYADRMSEILTVLERLEGKPVVEIVRQIMRLSETGSPEPLTTDVAAKLVEVGDQLATLKYEIASLRAEQITGQREISSTIADIRKQLDHIARNRQVQLPGGLRDKMRPVVGSGTQRLLRRNASITTSR